MIHNVKNFADVSEKSTNEDREAVEFKKYRHSDQKHDQSAFSRTIKNDLF